MIKKELGSTGINVSPIGLGTVKFGRNQGVKYPHAFELPSDQHIQSLLRCAQQLGINLLDTAPAYGVSEERLGKLLIGNRTDWVITTKVGEEFVDGQSFYDFSPNHFAKSIERSLKRLNTDYLDLVLIHSNGDDLKILADDAIFIWLEKLKKEGKIRAFGMSTKTIDGGIKALEKSDVVMVTYNVLEQAEKAVIEYAHKNKKGVLIKKALASGHLQRISDAIDFVFKQEGVSSIIVGTLNEAHLKEVVCRAG